MIRINKRRNTSSTWLFLAPNLAIVLTLISGIFIFSLLGLDPLRVFYIYFISPVKDLYGLSDLAIKASPLILIALGLSFAYKANVWNIGAEGQYILGALGGTAVALFFHGIRGEWILPLMIICAAISGMIWAIIPAFLRTRWNVNEILSSLMLNYVAIQLLIYLMHGLMRDPLGNNFPQTKILTESAKLAVLFKDTRIHTGVLIVIFLIPFFWLIASRGFFGFQVKVKGMAEAAARFAGFNENKLIIATMALSGALAGIAGIFEVAGPLGQLTSGFSSNYGYTAIIVAFLGRLHPVGITLAGLVIALTFLGGEEAQIVLGLPTAATGVFQGIFLFFLLACDFLRVYEIKYISKNS